MTGAVPCAARPEGREIGTVKFEAGIKEFVEKLHDLSELLEPLLIGRQFGILHRPLLAIARDDEVCRAPDGDTRVSVW